MLVTTYLKEMSTRKYSLKFLFILGNLGEY